MYRGDTDTFEIRALPTRRGELVFKYSQPGIVARRACITDGCIGGGGVEGFHNVLLHIHAYTSHYYLRARARQNGEESRIQKDPSPVSPPPLPPPPPSSSTPPPPPRRGTYAVGLASIRARVHGNVWPSPAPRTLTEPTRATASVATPANADARPLDILGFKCSPFHGDTEPPRYAN